jgi:DNA-directed RNA polymerase subunit RPC12/RpoP
MTHLHLDMKLLRALWAYRILAHAAPALLLLSTQGDSWLNETWWAWLASVFVAAVLGICAVLVSRRVGCPSCGHAALESYAPSWRQLKALYSRNAIRCEYCLETILTKVGTSPPSSISLQRP